jgi:pimeloyl-ACP methyl ester carboxylesterase
MPEFVTATDGVEIAFERHAPADGQSGASILLIHGFGSSRLQNWKSTGWYDGLAEAGFSLAAMDCRGHGDSGKPHDAAAYDHDRMAGDAVAVMDAAGLDAPFVCGYSMGGFIGLRLLAAHPDRVARLAVCGVGETYLQDRITSPEARAVLADALLTSDPAAITDPRARMFRAFADQAGKDRLALAACMRGMSPHLPLATLAALKGPILVACGEKDDTSGRPEPLAEHVHGGQAAVIPGKDHMSAVGDRALRRTVIAFFQA